MRASRVFNSVVACTLSDAMRLRCFGAERRLIDVKCRRRLRMLTFPQISPRFKISSSLSSVSSSLRHVEMKTSSHYPCMQCDRRWYPCSTRIIRTRRNRGTELALSRRVPVSKCLLPPCNVILPCMLGLADHLDHCCGRSSVRHSSVADYCCRCAR